MENILYSLHNELLQKIKQYTRTDYIASDKFDEFIYQVSHETDSIDIGFTKEKYEYFLQKLDEQNGLYFLVAYFYNVIINYCPSDIIENDSIGIKMDGITQIDILYHTFKQAKLPEEILQTLSHMFLGTDIRESLIYSENKYEIDEILNQSNINILSLCEDLEIENPNFNEIIKDSIEALKDFSEKLMMVPLDIIFSQSNKMVVNIDNYSITINTENQYHDNEQVLKLIIMPNIQIRHFQVEKENFEKLVKSGESFTFITYSQKMVKYILNQDIIISHESYITDENNCNYPMVYIREDIRFSNELKEFLK